MATHKLTVEGFGEYEVEAGKKLVKALEDSRVDVSHRCGGNARCTTCRVKFRSGEPADLSFDEEFRLTDDEVKGQFRLSCQIRVDRDMHVEVLMLASKEGWEPGPDVEP